MSEIRRRRKYTEEYRAEAVRLAGESEHSASQVARDLGINVTVLHRWVRQSRQAKMLGRTRAGVKAENEEVLRLRRELNRVTQERDFLKRAAAFFAKEST